MHAKSCSCRATGAVITILPSELNHRANIYGMKKLGVSHIISVSAVGSLKEAYRPTDIVLIDQFFDRTKRSEAFTFFGGGVVAHIAFADPICLRLQRDARGVRPAREGDCPRRGHLRKHGRTERSRRARSHSSTARWVGT